MTQAIRRARRRSVPILATLVLGILPMGQPGGAQAEQQANVVDGVHQAFHPGSFDGGGLIPSVDVPFCTGENDPPGCYAGEKLALQSTSVGRRALEPTIGVDKQGNAFFAASWHDDSKAIVLPVTHIRASFDGGLTWVDRTNRAPVVNEPMPPTNADPYVYVDAVTSRLFNPEAAGACLYMNFSDDQGTTWLTNPLVCGNVNVDHQSFGAGPFPPNLAPLKTIYPNVLYYCSNQVAFSMCNRSLDGGVVWTGAESPAFHGYDTAAGGLCGGLAGHLDTDGEGRLFLPKGHCSRPWLAISDDGAVTFRRTLVNSQLRAAGTHIAVATDDANNVYVLWWDPNFRLPWLAISKDHGATFGQPMMVAPPGVREVNFPEIEAGEAGKVAITFPGGTKPFQSGSATRPWNQYVVVTTNALDADPLFVSATANPTSDPVHRGTCGPGRCGAMWDFIELVISPKDGGVWASISDTCESVSCRGTGGVDNVSSGMGYAIRQVGGPRIRTLPAAP